MLSPKYSIVIFVISFFLLALSVAGINYAVDPNCEYRCHEVVLDRQSLNPYYQLAQKIIVFQRENSIEQVVIGSSRGQTTSPIWLEQETGLKTLNLSLAAADLNSNLVFLKMANQQKTLKQVIWFADYFEMIGSRTNISLQKMPALEGYLEAAALPPKNLLERIRSPFAIFDHKVFEASLHLLTRPRRPEFDRGAGSQIDYQKCLESDFAGTRSFQRMRDEVDIIYINYTSRVLVPLQSDDLYAKFKQEVLGLASSGVRFKILLNPYHPEFTRRLQNDYPEIYQRHLLWTEKISELSQASPNIIVKDYFSEGIPNSDDSPKFWDDGSHFNCLGTMLMLKPLL